MDSFQYDKVLHEINILSAYLNFTQDNLIKFRKSIFDELNISIHKLRESENIQPDVTDDEIILQCDLIVDSDEFQTTEKNPWLHICSIQDVLSQTDEFANLAFATIVIMFYSLVERGLITVFDLPNEKNDQNPISTAKFIMKSKGHRIDEAIWNELHMIRRLRNTIVHTGMSFEIWIKEDREGLIPVADAPKDLLDYLISKKVCDEFGAIKINFEYCVYLIGFAYKFFNNVSV